MYTDIFIVRRDCVFRNFRIFSFLEKAIFSLSSSKKDAHFFVFVTQKRYGNVAFSDYGNVRKSPKISSFRIFSRIFTMRKDMVLCSVVNTINGGEAGEYGKEYLKIKFNSDDNLTLNKVLNRHYLTIVVRSVFQEDNKYYPQAFLDECLYEL